MIDLSVRIGSLTLANPVMPASGTFAEGLERVMDFGRLGAFVTTSVAVPGAADVEQFWADLSAAYAEEIRATLVDDEPPLPAREELSVEEEQVVELEMALQREERSPLQLLQGAKLGLGCQQGCERRKVEGDAEVPVRLSP
jgi:hypothetical protein